MSNENSMDTADPEVIAEVEKIIGDRQWPVTIKLSAPVEFGDEAIDSLVFQKGTFGVLKGMSIDRTPNVDELQLIAARLCRRSLKVIELLDPADAAEVIAIALGFFARCRGVGKKL